MNLGLNKELIMDKNKDIESININRIQDFNEKHFIVIQKLLLQLSPDLQLPTKADFKQMLKSENTHLFIAELENSEIVGMITIGTYDIPSGKRIWIEDVVVDSSHRGKKYGEQLTVFAISYCKSFGGADIRLTSRPERIAANDLYQKLGFVKYETNVYKLTL